ncbi:conserved membrane hypothetical protein [Candidatus Methylobacter favarea]|uniref:DNA gyrase subunit B n=2 Tax=Candidatus Methylobacter favarea TaxID=2707345 RepID=A0A8S0WR96_9GAMM|nr:conserved membrane hypothetical protein [Candidatus Methylobacter favarea]
MHHFINSVTGLLTLVYPFAVYFGINYLEPRQIAAMLVILLLIRVSAGHSAKYRSAPLLIAGIVYCGFAIWINNLVTLRFYPVLVNGMMLLVFSWSLVSPPSLIERLARFQHPDLPPEGIIYTRRVTQAWCVFFIINGSMALATALWSSFEFWSLYNGLIAYLLMGALFGAEYIIRMRTQKYVR